MKQKIYFYYPNIINDGIKKTYKVYKNYLKKNYKVILIKNKNNYFTRKFKILNAIICALKIILLKEKKKIIFSLDDHLIILIFKIIGFNFKLILRTANPIFNIYNKSEQKFIRKEGFTSKYETYLYKYADLVITYSKQNVLSLKKKFNVNNVHLVYNFFRKYKYQKKIKKNIYNVFFVGRFVESKDPIFFLTNVIKLLNKININIFLLGEGVLKKKLITISKKYEKNVKIFKFTKEPFKKFNKKIDLICITSKFDGTPNVLGEAISRSIPCLAPKNVGLANILLNNGKGGYLYKQSNNKSFQENLIFALKNYKTTIKKAKQAYKNLDKFNEKNTLFKLENLIKKII